MIIKGTICIALSNTTISKKVIVFCLILFYSGLMLFARTLEAEGSGFTLDEAKRSAQVNLASSLQSKVASTSLLMITEQSMQAKEVFLENTTVSVDLDLFGVQFGIPKQQGNLYTVNAFITESSIPQYLQKLTTTKQSIEEIEIRTRSESSLDTRKNNTALLLRYYNDFESYSYIVRALDANAQIPLLKRTKAGAELDYYQILTLQRTSLQQDLKNVSLQSEASLQIQQISKKLVENRKEIEAWQSVQKTQREQMLKQTDKLLQQSMLAMEQLASDRLKEIFSTSTAHQDPLTQIANIEQKKQTYKAIRDDRDVEFEKQKKEVIDKYDIQIKELENQLYRMAEMANGIPTDAAKENKQRTINNLIKSRDTEIEIIDQLLNESVTPQLNTLEQTIVAEYIALEKEMYTLSSLGNEVTIKIGSYDGYRTSWPVAIRFSALGVSYAYDLYIPYETITGKRVPLLTLSEGENDVYTEYLDTVDIFEAYFGSFTKPILCSVKYSIQIGSEPSTYVVLVDSYQLSRTDLDTVIHKESFAQEFDKAKVYTAQEPINIPEIYESRYQNYIKRKIKIKEKAFQASQNPCLGFGTIFINYNQGGGVEIPWKDIFTKTSVFTPYLRLGIGYILHLPVEDERFEIGLNISIGYTYPLIYTNFFIFNWNTSIGLGLTANSDYSGLEYINIPGNITTGFQIGFMLDEVPVGVKIDAGFKYFGWDFGYSYLSFGVFLNAIK